jgi:HSP20 family molecular chaperone IbpA
VNRRRSAGAKVTTEDVSHNGRLVEGGCLVDRGSGLFNGLVNEFEKLSPPVDIVEDREGYRFSIELPV